MSDCVIDPPAIPSVALADSQSRCALRHSLRGGRNYAVQAREMGKNPGRVPPFLCARQADAVPGYCRMHSLRCPDYRPTSRTVS